MDTLKENSQTPLGYKNRSPFITFLNKNKKVQLSKSSICKSSNLASTGKRSKLLKETNSFHIFPVVKTPPTKRSSKIVNPFEAALTERLHLPLIGSSPTLFQRPLTPQHSSTQFAWTIDDVSSLQPANVEPHETQFHDSPDPDYEAKAQSAISSYFKEQQIVPSPIDCQLRNQRIILSELSGNTPMAKPGHRIRDNVAQTVLSLPPQLPKELESALAPYFNFNENQQNNVSSQYGSVDSSLSMIDHDVRDISLRRKLFGYQNLPCMEDDTDTESIMLTVNSPPPESPDVIKSKISIYKEPFYKSNHSDSVDKSSFGSLSPIEQCLSPPNLKRKSRIETINNFKPNMFAARAFSCLDYKHEHSKNWENTDSPPCKKSPKCCFTTPIRSLAGRSSSPYSTVGGMSIDSIVNDKIISLQVDSAKVTKHCIEIDIFGDETQDMDQDDMQVSQLSAISNVSSESDTPRKRRSASRKNLSQSFSLQQGSKKDHLNDVENGNMQLLGNQHSNIDESSANQNEPERSLFHRTDSGFNEMTTSSSQYEIKFSNDKTTFHQNEDDTNKNTADILCNDANKSIMCCSTPSKSHAIF